MPDLSTARMIAADGDFIRAPLLRREFLVESGHGEVAAAVLRITGFGVFEAFLNGTPVSEDVLSPGWSSYEWRLRYRDYEVTNLLQPRSVLGVALGNGWFRGRLGWNGNRAFYGSELAVMSQLEIRFADGHVQSIVTDESWTAGPSAVVANDLYDGETIDAQLVSDDWKVAGAALPDWVGVHTLVFDPRRLTPYVGPPVRRQQTVRPVAMFRSPSGKLLVDFGQNLVGWVRFTVQGQRGATITIRHAEVLEHGDLGVRPLRDAKATDHLILSGGADFFEPTLTFHGFRYVEVSGWPQELTLNSLEAVVVHSDLSRTGQFECSDPLLNQLHRNVVWSLRGNFLDVPTDCPQRNERLGWTGDLAVFAPTAAYLYDVSSFLADWLADLACEQHAAQGRVPFVVPDVLKYETRPAEFPAPESTAIWSDAAAWVPWALWQAYGDAQALRQHYPAMAAHARRVESLLSDTGLWDRGFQFGDWLDPQAPPDQPFLAKADSAVVATACYHHTLRLVSAAASALGETADSEYFAALADQVRTAFTKHYVHDDGTIRSDCATVYALAIVFDLLDETDRQRAGDRLAQLVADNGFRVSTGFAGTPYVPGALSATGHLDTAYRLLLERECPSWLYPVTMGATTVWERWDSMLPDGTINPGEMTSFNHYALGAVADWMHRTIVGIAPLQPGYAKVLIAPQPGGGLTWAKGSLETRNGLITASWTIDEGGTMTLDATIPDGVDAVIRLPGQSESHVRGGHHRIVAEL